MKVLRRHAQQLGFIGTGLSPTAQFQPHWYKAFDKQGLVLGISNLVPQGVYKFKLTSRQMQDFRDGKVSLVPPGCCNASGGRSIEKSTWVYQGEIRSLNHLREIIVAALHQRRVYEPKHTLNREEEMRWRELVTREAVGIDGGHPNIKPLTPPEIEELERLQHKRYRKIRSHPRMKPVKAAERRQNRKLKRLLAELEQAKVLVAKLEKLTKLT